MKEVEKFEIKMWQYDNYPKELEYIEVLSLKERITMSIEIDGYGVPHCYELTYAPNIFARSFNYANQYLKN